MCTTSARRQFHFANVYKMATLELSKVPNVMTRTFHRHVQQILRSICRLVNICARLFLLFLFPNRGRMAANQLISPLKPRMAIIQNYDTAVSSAGLVSFQVEQKRIHSPSVFIFALQADRLTDMLATLTQLFYGILSCRAYHQFY